MIQIHGFNKNNVSSNVRSYSIGSKSCLIFYKSYPKSILWYNIVTLLKSWDRFFWVLVFCVLANWKLGRIEIQYYQGTFILDLRSMTHSTTRIIPIRYDDKNKSLGCLQTWLTYAHVSLYYILFYEANVCLDKYPFCLVSVNIMFYVTTKIINLVFR